jgi:hypothetical protein
MLTVDRAAAGHMCEAGFTAKFKGHWPMNIV